MNRQIRLSLLGVLCFGLAATQAPSQTTEEVQWEIAMVAARNANQRGDYSEAENQLKVGLEIAEELGEEDSRLTLSLKNLARFYHTQKKYPAAEGFYLRALEIDEKRLGKEDLDLAASLNTLGLLYKDWKKYADAEPLYRRALEIVEKANGREHPSVGASLNNLASLYVDMGNYADAELLFKRSLAILENALGEKHPNVAAVLENYAVLLGKTNRESEAAKMVSRAKTIRDLASRVGQNEGSEVFRVGGDVTAPKLIHKVDLEFSEVARNAKREGTVVLSFVVQRDGTVRDIKVIQSVGFGLDEKAIEAVRQWRFNPATKGGKPVDVSATTEVTFRFAD